MSLLFSMLGHLIALTGAIVAVLGNTWDSNRTGWQKLRPTGWIASVVALAGFVIASIVATDRYQKEQVVLDIARADIKRAAVTLTIPFALVLWEIRKDRVEPNEETLAAILKDDLFDGADVVEFDGTPPHPIYRTWGNAVCAPTKNGLNQLLRVRDNYQDVLGGDELKVINMIIDHQWAPRMTALAPCGTIIPGNGFTGYFSNEIVHSYVSDLVQLHRLVSDVPSPNRIGH